jgi:hypothetical protein
MPTLGGAATEAPSESQLVQGSPLLSTDGEPTCAARAANAGGTPSDLQPSPALGPVALPVPEAQEYRPGGRRDPGNRVDHVLLPYTSESNISVAPFKIWFRLLL